jgi:hypothetical protein
MGLRYGNEHFSIKTMKCQCCILVKALYGESLWVRRLLRNGYCAMTGTKCMESLYEAWVYSTFAVSTESSTLLTSDHSKLLMVHSSSENVSSLPALLEVGPALILKEVVCLLNTWKRVYLWYFIRLYTCIRFKAVRVIFLRYEIPTDCSLNFG